MNIKERAENSNEETIVIEKELVSIKEHLALNKILIGKDKETQGISGGFFKIVNNTLQLHTFTKVEDKKKWQRFLMLDALPEEIERNRKLNVLETKK